VWCVNNSFCCAAGAQRSPKLSSNLTLLTKTAASELTVRQQSGRSLYIALQNGSTICSIADSQFSNSLTKPRSTAISARFLNAINFKEDMLMNPCLTKQSSPLDPWR
jgi:hypothetical protein